MKKKWILYPLILLLINFSCTEEVENYSQYVNPFVGTGGHGHTYPGASLPFGMVQLSPDTRLDGWDGCSGYHFSDSIVYGFSHTHLSGTGVSDYADILLMPTVGKLKLQPGTPENRSEGYCSAFRHEMEKAEPGFYKTVLDDYGIRVELTVTQRVGLHKYIFPETENANIVLDLSHRDHVLDSYLKVVSDNEIEGYRHSKAWAKDQRLFFVIQFSRSFDNYSIALNDTVLNDISEQKGQNVKAGFLFKTHEGEEIMLRVGISAVDIEGARKNLEAEITDWNFKKIKDQAREIWNKELAKIEVKGGSVKQQRIFYTALYHSFLTPNLYTDVDGRYRGTDLEIHQAEGFTNYTVFSLWDTYRAAHPLYILVQQERTSDFVHTMLAQYENGGILPMWEFAGNYTQCMIGYHAVPVIADAYIKGIRDFDTEKALAAMLHSAEHTQLGLDAYQKYGFIPLDKEHESVSKTLEYAYDDWTIAQFAEAIGNDEIYRKYLVRAQFYKNIFDAESGFMRPKMNGSWKKPFDPREVDFNYTEANAWQYSFYVPQDITGLMDLLGGQEAFVAKLDLLFEETSKTTGRNQVDITGLIGQYAHGNEPSHHMAYLYNYASHPWKTQQRVHHILNEMYADVPDGLSGNEDCGQMSAWYVLSSMGFYPVTPASNLYAIGTPLFPEAIIHAGNEPFVIKANHVSETNFYIQSATLNGQKHTKSYITHNDIMNGGELILEMGAKPNTSWAVGLDDLPVSKIDIERILPVPYFVANGRTFYDRMQIEMRVNTPNTKIFYTLDGSVPTEKSLEYVEILNLMETTEIKAIAINNEENKSFIIDAKYFKIPKNRSIKILSKYSNQYTAGGDNGLIDFIRGGDDFRNGSWQGYQDQDFEAIVDLGKLEIVSRIGANFLQDINSWIWMPTKVKIWISVNGVHYKEVASIPTRTSSIEYGSFVEEFVQNIKTQKARYIKIKAYNYGTIPDWHLGKEGEAFIFIDEIIIE